jgi:hypothetical protein
MSKVSSTPGRGGHQSFAGMIERHRARAYEGDVDAAQQYMVCLPNARRGEEVLNAYRAGVPVPSLRAMLEMAWNQDHDILVAAAGHNLKRLFEAAEFDVSCLPPKVTLWRGGVCFFRDEYHFETPWTLLRGIAWSARREVACFFATTFRAAETRLTHLPDAYPCVIRVAVPRKSVLAYITDRSEDELIAYTGRLRSHCIDDLELNPRDVGKDWRPPAQVVAGWRAAAQRWHSNPYGEPIFEIGSKSA